MSIPLINPVDNLKTFANCLDEILASNDIQKRKLILEALSQLVLSCYSNDIKAGLNSSHSKTESFSTAFNVNVSIGEQMEQQRIITIEKLKVEQENKDKNTIDELMRLVQSSLQNPFILRQLDPDIKPDHLKLVKKIGNISNVHWETLQSKWESDKVNIVRKKIPNVYNPQSYNTSIGVAYGSEDKEKLVNLIHKL